MRVILISIILVLSINLSAEAQGYQNNDTQQMLRNRWAIGMFYSDNGFGVSGTYSSRLARTSDLNIKLSISGVTDNTEVEHYDYYGNSYVNNKVNRLYMATLSFGIKHNIFFDDIEGNFKPLIKAGLAPSLILITPYNRSFFQSFQYSQTSFGIGGYAGIGLEYYESNSIGLGITLEYYYIPVVGPDVYSLQDKKISNVGGVQIGFNFMFLN